MGKYRKNRPTEWLYHQEDKSEYNQRMYNDIQDSDLHILEKQLLHATMQFHGMLDIVVGAHGVRRTIKDKLEHINESWKNVKIEEKHIRKMLHNLQDRHFVYDVKEQLVFIEGKKHPRTRFTLKINGKFLRRNAEMNRTDFAKLQ